MFKWKKEQPKSGAKICATCLMRLSPMALAFACSLQGWFDNIGSPAMEFAANRPLA